MRLVTVMFSTGELKVTHFNDEATLLNEITTINPNEVVINDNISDNLKRQINMVTETITVGKRYHQKSIV